MNNGYGNYPQYNVNYNAGSPQHQQAQSKKALRIGVFVFSFVFIFTGVIFFGISTFISKIYEHTEAKCTETVSALVTDNVKKTNSDGDTSFAPVYTYTVDGEVYSVQSPFSSSPAVYEIGDTAKLCYDPSDPKQIYDPKALKTFRIVMNVFRYVGIGLAAVGFIAAIAAFVLTRKKRTDTRDELELYNGQYR